MIKYLLIFHMLLLIILWIVLLFRKSYLDNIYCYIPILGIQSTVKSLLIALFDFNKISEELYKTEKSKREKEETDDLRSKIIYISEKICDYNSKGHYFNPYDVDVEYIITRMNNDDMLKRNFYRSIHDETTSAFTKVFFIYNNNRNIKKIESLFLNMIDIIYEVVNNVEVITEDIRRNILNVIKEYESTLVLIEKKENEILEENKRAKAKKQEKYINLKLNSIKDTLKSIQEDLKG